MPRNKDATSVDQTTEEPLDGAGPVPVTDDGGMPAAATVPEYPTADPAGDPLVTGDGPADRDAPPVEGEWVAGRHRPRPEMDADPLAGPDADPLTGPDSDPLVRADAATPDAGTSSATDTRADDADLAASAPPASAGSPADPVPAAGRPGPLAGETAPTPGQTAGDLAGGSLMTDEDALRENWLRIQSEFVDDPKGAVTQAAGFVSDITGTLVTALQDRERTLRHTWEGDSSADTENLRNALREYRSFFETLVKL